MRAQAVDVLLRVGLAALAVSDYVRTVLCPQLQGHEPEPARPELCKQVSLVTAPCGPETLQGWQLLCTAAWSLLRLPCASQVGVVREPEANVPCREMA